MGAAISCYICQSRSNPACSDPIKQFKLELTECTPEVLTLSSRELAHGLNGFSGLNNQEATDLIIGNPPSEFEPMKCQKINFNFGEERVVIRGCQAVGNRWSGTQSDLCRKLEQKALQQHETYINYCNTCNEDGCNAAPGSSSTSAWLMLLTVVVAVLIR
ncbi:UPAR/Ly6 domain-containing protein crok-like [Arctopsyche grandis]|uniref:UPAR/Ly6 domain-containing protein crok-like n=1 Tax=Arctopsyche grandis TaxID=121162 RepID=UPI00406D9937